jgi:hypothetical protein
VAGLSRATTFQGNLEFARLLIIDADYAVRATSGERGAIGFVVDSEELIQLIMDGMQKFATRCVPVLKGAICIDRNQNVLSYTWSCQWSPSKEIIK